MSCPVDPRRELERNGWVLLRSPYSLPELEQLRNRLSGLAELNDEAVRGRSGAVYAARNVLDLCPELVELWRTPTLVEFVLSVLGPEAALVRGLYFDKPPEQTWALPWHKDLLIAVQDGPVSEGYSRPRPRAGVPHTEPPLEVLEQMLTLRIHLDAMTEDNGPLEVLTGSHVTGKRLWIAGFEPARITSDAGDVLAMRPLLVHSSGRSNPACRAHRRVLHLEFSASAKLPGGVRWHARRPLSAAVPRGSRTSGAGSAASDSVT